MNTSIHRWAAACLAGLSSLGGAQAQTLPPQLDLGSIGQYLLIGTGNGQTGDAINVQKTELGADQRFVSNPDPNLKDVFDAPGKRRWNSDTGRTYATGDLASAPVFQGIDHSGHMALTSKTGGLTLSNTTVYATDFAVRCASGAGTGTNACRDNLQSASNAAWVSPAGSQGQLGQGAGVVGNHDHKPLTDALTGARSFIAGLNAESTWTQNLEYGQSSLDIDALDHNKDGFAVIDIQMKGGGDWKLNDHDLILNGNGSTTAIFRIRGNTNMLMSNSSIALGTGGIGKGGAGTAPSALGALFVQYEEPTGNTDKVFNFQNVILNGVGIWDLNAFRKGAYDDAVNTELTVQNGQGCAQFISSSINFTSSVRWNSCGMSLSDVSPVPEPGSASAMALGLLALGVRLAAARCRRRPHA